MLRLIHIVHATQRMITQSNARVFTLLTLAHARNVSPVRNVTYSLEICSTFPVVRKKLTNQKYPCRCGHNRHVNHCHVYKMDDKKLIDLVRTFPCIYDIKSPDFKILLKKENGWEAIASSLDRKGKLF